MYRAARRLLILCFVGLQLLGPWLHAHAGPALARGVHLHLLADAGAGAGLPESVVDPLRGTALAAEPEGAAIGMPVATVRGAQRLVDEEAAAGARLAMPAGPFATPAADARLWRVAPASPGQASPPGNPLALAYRPTAPPPARVSPN